MDSNFVASEIVGKFDKITLLVLMSSGRSYILSIIMSFLTIKYGTQNKRQLLRYLGIGRSLTKGCESCCWHIWIRIRVPGTTITPYLGHTKVLCYVYWAFAPCIVAFQYCRPVISIDGTHLYGKYKGVLMIAMATDANQKVLPFAFTFVDKESGPS